MRISVDERKQRSLIRSYWREWRKALAKTTAPAIEMSREMQPEALQMMIRGFNNTEHLRTLMIELWGNVGSKFAEEMQRRIIGRKEEVLWEDMFRNYMFERSLKKAKSILTTQQEEINRIIDVVVGRGDTEGWSIDRISEEITRQLERDMTKIQGYHAERIARTEVIGASNKGSFDSALRSGLGIRKQWLTSGLKGIRDSHLIYESLGLKSIDYSYAAGLKHPGDPAGAPSEIINCRCTIIYDVDN